MQRGGASVVHCIHIRPRVEQSCKALDAAHFRGRVERCAAGGALDGDAGSSGEQEALGIRQGGGRMSSEVILICVWKDNHQYVILSKSAPPPSPTHEEVKLRI